MDTFFLGLWAVLKWVGLAFLFVMPVASLLTWAERRQSAMMQDRLGPNRANIGKFRAWGILHFVADESDPWGLVGRYLAALAPGSYLALSHLTCDKLPPGMVQAVRETYDRATEQAYPRSKAELERFFTRLELTEPYPGAGPVLCHLGLWEAEDPATADSDGSRIMYCGVARRP